MGWSSRRVLTGLLVELVTYSVVASAVGLAAATGLSAIVLRFLSAVTLPDGRTLDIALRVSASAAGWSLLAGIVGAVVVAATQWPRLRRIATTDERPQPGDGLAARPRIWAVLPLFVLASCAMYLLDLVRPAPWVFLSLGTVLLLLAAPLVIAGVRLAGRVAVANLELPAWARLAAYEIRFEPARLLLHVLMVGLVVLASMFAASAAHFIQNQPDLVAAQVGGPYDLLVEAGPSATVDRDRLLAVDGVAAVSTVERFATAVGGSPEDGGSIWAVSLVDDDFGTSRSSVESIEDAPLWAPEITSALRAARPVAVVPDGVGIEVGDDLHLWTGGDGSRPVEVVALHPHAARTGSGLIVPRAVGKDLARVQIIGFQFFVAVDDPGAAESVATEINRQLGPSGAVAATFLTRTITDLGPQTRLLQVLQAYTMLGLMAGTIGLAAVYTRHFNARERELVLLSVNGFRPADVSRSILAETSVSIAIGTLVGIGVGAYVSWQMLVHGSTFADGLAFGVPVPSVALLVVTGAVMASLSAALPVRLARRLEPGSVLSRAG